MPITAQYLDPLRLEQLSVDRWGLLHEFRFDSALVGARIIVDAGFVTDLESVPRPITLAYSLLSGYAHGPAILHDWAYRMKLWPREKADALFLEAMETDGTALGIPPVPAWRRYAFYVGVRLGGWWPWESDRVTTFRQRQERRWRH